MKPLLAFCLLLLCASFSRGQDPDDGNDLEPSGLYKPTPMDQLRWRAHLIHIYHDAWSIIPAQKGIDSPIPDKITNLPFSGVLDALFAQEPAPRLDGVNIWDLYLRQDIQQEVLASIAKDPAFRDRLPLTARKLENYPKIGALFKTAMLNTSFVAELNRQLQKHGKKITDVGYEELYFIQGKHGLWWSVGVDLIIDKDEKPAASPRS